MKKNEKKSVSLQVREQAKSIFPLLLEMIRSGNPKITYAELAKKTEVAVCNLRFPLDHISETLSAYVSETGNLVPPIQVVIVNAKTGVPGPGASPYIQAPYLKKGTCYKDLSKAEQKQTIQSIYVALKSYQDWDNVEREIRTRL